MLFSPAREELVFRVLALFPHPRHTGQVVVDEHGLVPGSAVSCSTRRFPTLVLRAGSVARLVATAANRYRPHAIGILRSTGCAWRDVVTGAAERAAEGTGVPVHVFDEPAIHAVFCEAGARGYDQLGQAVTRLFFPELVSRVKSWRRGEEDVRRRIRPVWKAAAAAVVVLAKHRPESVGALAREALPPALASLLRGSSAETRI